MADFTMPSLGADMEDATLMQWFVKPGDAVKRGNIVAEVETDKGLIEIECFETGVVEKLVIEPGASIPVGAVMAVIRTAGAAPVGPAASPVSAAAAAPVEPSPSTSPSEPAVPAPSHRASPLARKVARQFQSPESL